MTPLEIGSYIPGAENFINQAADIEPNQDPDPATPVVRCPNTDDECPY